MPKEKSTKSAHATSVKPPQRSNEAIPHLQTGWQFLHIWMKIQQRHKQKWWIISVNVQLVHSYSHSRHCPVNWTHEKSLRNESIPTQMHYPRSSSVLSSDLLWQYTEYWRSSQSSRGIKDKRGRHSCWGPKWTLHCIQGSHWSRFIRQGGSWTISHHQRDHWDVY